jgi:hypothetical protein
MLNLFLRNVLIPIEIKYPAATSDKASSEERLHKSLIDHYKLNKPIRVIFESDERLG